MLSRKGAGAVGLPLRRAPRTDSQREHELALVWLVIQLERAGDVLVRTERECRTLEAEGAGRRYSVPVVRAGRPVERRWPDVVLEGGSRRCALELELSAKGASRIAAIMSAYAAAPCFTEVVFLAADVSIARLLSRVLARSARPALNSRIQRAQPAIRIAPWPALSPGAQAVVADVVAAS
jgi:hypothetical protein